MRIESISVSQRTPFRGSQLFWMVVLLLAGEVIGLAVSFATKASNPELSKAFAAGVATLFFGALLGGIVGLLIADFDRRRVRRAAQIEYLTNILSDLKDVYDQVDRGRTLVAAHQSAKTYGDEMRNFIQARVKLQQVIRAVKFDDRGSAVAAIQSHVEEMEGYLKLLVDEFQQKYKEISLAQSVFQARLKKALEQSPTAENKEPVLPRNEPWERIAVLVHVRDFLRSVDNCQTPGVDKSDYCLQFLTQLDMASSKLREALSVEFEDRTFFRATRPRQKELRDGRSVELRS